MRSVMYMLGGKPRNLDDSIDHAAKSRPVRVRVRLGMEESITEFFIRQEFIGQFDWVFPEMVCHCRDYYGYLSQDDPPHVRASVIEQANAKLQRRLARISELGVPVEMEGKERFDGLTVDKRSVAI